MLFAVTVETPGGVVVSKRERIVVTAAPKTGYRRVLRIVTRPRRDASEPRAVAIGAARVA